MKYIKFLLFGLMVPFIAWSCNSSSGDNPIPLPQSDNLILLVMPNSAPGSKETALYSNAGGTWHELVVSNDPLEFGTPIRISNELTFVRGGPKNGAIALYRISNGTDVTKIENLAINKPIIQDTNGDIYASSSNAGIYKSTDKGKTWVLIEQFGNTASASEFFLNSQNDLFVSVRDSNKTLYKKTTDGWVVSDKDKVNLLSIFELTNGNVYAGTSGSATTYKSTDYGATWQSVGNEDVNFTTFAVNSDKVAIIDTGRTIGNKQIFKRTLDSVNWEELADMGKDLSGLAAFKKHFYITNIATPLTSIDNGTSWSAIPGMTGNASNIYAPLAVTKNAIYFIHLTGTMGAYTLNILKSTDGVTFIKENGSIAGITVSLIN